MEATAVVVLWCLFVSSEVWHVQGEIKYVVYGCSNVSKDMIVMVYDPKVPGNFDFTHF